MRVPQTLQEPAAAACAAKPPLVAVPEPIRVWVEDTIERWIETRDGNGRLISALELLSPGNKVEGAERDRYRRKRRVFFSGGANLVEIDLVRRGTFVFPAAVVRVLQQAGACYGVCVVRAVQPAAHEVYPMPLRERLRPIRIPLRPADADAVVDLQVLLDQCHERGRYHLLDYRQELDPPAAPEEAQWVDEVLRAHALR